MERYQISWISISQHTKHSNMIKSYPGAAAARAAARGIFRPSQMGCKWKMENDDFFVSFAVFRLSALRPIGVQTKTEKMSDFQNIIFCGPSKRVANENCKPRTPFYCRFFLRIAKIDYLQAEFIEKRRNLRRSAIPSITDFFVTVSPYIIYRLYQMVFLTRLN